MTKQNPNHRPIAAAIPRLETPLENIALAFSGGGFRAAGFALGTLAYLKKAGLLEKVTYMSSASGGTIATAMYALNNAEGKDFGEFYKKLYQNLGGVDLLTEVFSILNDKKAWQERPFKRRNFINSFAMTYDKLLFDRHDLGALTGSKTTHLQEVCFNTTEFYRGILFRQTVKMQYDSKEIRHNPGLEDNNDAEGDSTYLYGNFIINLDHNAARNLKLADLLAASSCFPGGFEPIIFPDDFENKNTLKSTDKNDPHRYLLSNLTVEPQELNDSEIELLYGKAALDKIKKEMPHPIDVSELQKRVKQEPLQGCFKAGFMDGGITDNQGVESMLRANDRRVKGETDFKPFDLMMVCDVGSHFMDPYQLPKQDDNSGMTIVGTRRLSWALILSGLALVWYCAYLTTAILPVVGIVVGGLLAVLGAGIVFAIGWMKRFIKSGTKKGGGLNLDKNFSPQIVAMMFKYLGLSPMSVVAGMIKERGSSMLTLTNDVFLKRIRQLLYQRFFDPEKCSDREKASHVYDLSFTNDTNRMQNDPPHLAPSRDIQLVAERAFNIGTTLWFDKDSIKNGVEPVLIATGQFTTCYNMLLYIQRVKKAEVYNGFTKEVKDHLNSIEDEMNTHYEAFKKDPFWLYNEQGRKYVDSNNWKDYKLDNMELPDNFAGLR
jgi:hypothetical protein